MGTPIQIHPENNKLFLFRGKPLVLITATEHYGAVMNRPFRFERYLEDTARRGITLTRLFVLFRELQSACNPYSTCKPESPDYIAPFLRVGPGKALDLQPKYDLDQWNPEFFYRLHRFLSLASDYGIIVEVVLLSNTYAPEVWSLNPLHARNNINDLPEIPWQEYNCLRHDKVVERQLMHVRKIVEETKGYDNIIYEICNEPGGNAPGIDCPPSPEDVDTWQIRIAKAIREAEGDTMHPHLIAGHEAFTYTPWEHSATKSFSNDFPLDVVNMHPLPNLTWQGKGYDMGEFMSKQLCLRPYRDFCLDTWQAPKPLNMDEDNVASQYKDYDGWTIHRKRAWTALCSGAHYDYIDFSIINYCETGTDASQSCIRSWMGYLSRFIYSLELDKAHPIRNWLHDEPEPVCASVFGVPGKEYAIYLADAREITDRHYGEVLDGLCIHFDLPEGPFEVGLLSPETGMYSPWWPITGGNNVELKLPSFTHDLLVHIRSAM